ncbi:hypothetical protein KI387_014140, partial [Taxus chinensis]
MNHQTPFDHHLSLSLQNLYRVGLGDTSQAQNLRPARSFNNHQESMKFANEIAAAPHPLGDLGAVVHNCNVEGFQNAFLSVDRPALSIPHPPHFQDFYMHGEHKPRVQSLTNGWITNEAKEEERESLKRQRSFTTHLLPCSSFRENHIVSERLRRSEMNELLAQMRSLLPNPTVKSDKASILTETIKYIESLKCILAIHSKKPRTTILPNAIKSKAISKEQKLPFTRCDKSTCTKYCERHDNLNVKYDRRHIFITINSMNKKNLLPSIILAVESHDIQVMDAFVSVTERVTFLCLHAK